MTQVKDMIDEKLDFALADQLGWVNAWDGIRLVWLDGKTNEFRRKVTDWHPSTDPAASLEVQAKAIEVDARKFALCLYLVRVKSKTGVNIKPSEVANGPHLSINIVADLLNASPRERAEAAYMTLQAGKWAVDANCSLANSKRARFEG